MAEARLRDSVDGFAYFLGELTAALDPAEGWYGVFAQRDPEGLRACLEGREVPPWDVVESLLHDLAGRHGEQAAAEAGARARQLHGTAMAAYDALTGGPEVVRERLDAMLGELRHATDRERDLRAALEQADPATDTAALSGELAWAADDVARAQARVRELRQRIAEQEGGEGAEGAVVPESAEGALAPHAPLVGGPAAYVPVAEDAVYEPDPPAAYEFVAEPPEAEQEPPAARRGAGEGDGRESAKQGERPAAGSGSGPSSLPPLPPQARQAVTSAVTHLAELRAAERGGEAHAVLCAAARRPAEELPYIAEELERSGLAADVSTLLWEVACLPPEPLAAAAGALAAAGRVQDCVSLLRQGVARPVGEVGDAALALRAAGRTAEARELLAAMVRARTAAEAAGLAGTTDAPEVLLPLLLEAADSVSEHRRRDLVHALRTAGVSDRLIGVR
ncbi:hypothetical protein [Streptomyces sclerotialus]|uniref:hypothetical protein n=1 Tax=Streptomyces sclerotialus TaxID=1957 RepID=UPI00068B5A13